MAAFLVSPVSWVHHMHWGVVVVGALLGDGRTRARLLAALAAAALLWMRLPWWGVTVLADGLAPRWAGRILQNGYTVFALLAIAALWWLVARRHPEPAVDPSSRGTAAELGGGAVRRG
jgi:alpha-1,2-mannosyltransferase